MPDGTETALASQIPSAITATDAHELRNPGYRLRDKDLGAPNRAKSAEFA